MWGGGWKVLYFLNKFFLEIFFLYFYLGDDKVDVEVE